MKVGVKLLRVLALNVFVKIVKVEKIGFFIAGWVIGFINQHLFAPEVERSHHDRDVGSFGDVVKTALPFGDSFARTLGGERKYKFILVVEHLDDRINHVTALGTIHGLSAQRPEDEPKRRFEQGVLPDKTDVELLGEFDSEAKWKVPIGGVGAGNDDIFVKMMRKIVDDLPAEQAAQYEF